MTMKRRMLTITLMRIDLLRLDFFLHKEPAFPPVKSSFVINFYIFSSFPSSLIFILGFLHCFFTSFVVLCGVQSSA